MTNVQHTHHDSIYLTDELGDEISWCQDSQNDRDIKYLLATPAREVAPELLDRLEAALTFIDLQIGPDSLTLQDECRQVIAKARTMKI